MDDNSVSKPVQSYEGYSIPKILTFLIILIILISALVYLLLPVSSTPAIDCGDDIDCFIENADNCENVIVREDIGDGTIVKYTSKNCVFTKAIEFFNPNEPEEFVSLFKGKSMKCPYEKFGFDETLVYGLDFTDDSCKGDLEDAINNFKKG